MIITSPRDYRSKTTAGMVSNLMFGNRYSQSIKQYSLVLLIISLLIILIQPNTVSAAPQIADVSDQPSPNWISNSWQRLSAVQENLIQRLETVRPLIPAVRKLLDIAPLLPELIGYEGEKHYLILLQNNHELRATGGFITSVGRLTLEDGRIKQLFFADSHKIYNENSEYPWAPPPMQQYMGVDLMFLRDANWSPDLPTAAQIIRSIYLQDRNVAIDGVVTLDLHAVKLLIDALGPLEIDNVSEPLTGENVMEQIKILWHEPPQTGDTAEDAGFGVWWHQRKSFIPALVKSVQAQLSAGNVNYARVAAASLVGLNARSIQVWLTHEQVAEQLAAFQWDGGLHPTPEIDFLTVVDSNLGYNKVDAVLERSLEYSIEWPETQERPAIATARLHYAHPIARAEHVCDTTPRYGETYDDMAARCYFNYVRLFVPAGSQLIKAEGVEFGSISSRRGEKRTQVLAGYFQLEPGQEKTVLFQYELPSHITEENYQLQVQRQSGTAPLQLSLDISQQPFMTTLYAGYLTWQAGDEEMVR